MCVCEFVIGYVFVSILLSLYSQWKSITKRMQRYILLQAEEVGEGGIGAGLLYVFICVCAKYLYI